MNVGKKLPLSSLKGFWTHSYVASTLQCTGDFATRQGSNPTRSKIILHTCLFWRYHFLHLPLTNHINNLKLVFLKLSGAGLKPKPSKCSNLWDCLKFLGHEVCTTGICPMDNNIEAINKMSTPNNLRKIQMFLGITGYFQQLIKEFAQLSEPLLLLLRGVPFKWAPV